MVWRMERTASGPEVAISAASSLAAIPDLGQGRQPVAESDAVRLLAGDPPPDIEELQGVLMPGDERQRHRQPEPVMEAKLGEVGHEAGLGRRHPEVRRAGQAQAAPDGGTLYRGHDWLLGVEQPHRLPVQTVRSLLRERIGLALGAEVGAGTEVLAL